LIFAFTRMLNFFMDPQLNFTKNALQLHEQEMKEMQALIGQDNYKDNRKFWEGEMSNAIRELQNEFDRRLDHQNQQMQSYYQMKVCLALLVNC